MDCFVQTVSELIIDAQSQLSINVKEPAAARQRTGRKKTRFVILSRNPLIWQERLTLPNRVHFQQKHRQNRQIMSNQLAAQTISMPFCSTKWHHSLKLCSSFPHVLQSSHLALFSLQSMIQHTPSPSRPQAPFGFNRQHLRVKNLSLLKPMGWSNGSLPIMAYNDESWLTTWLTKVYHG